MADGTNRTAQLHSAEIGREAAGFRKINKRKRRTENDEDGNGMTLIQDVRRELKGVAQSRSQGRIDHRDLLRSMYQVV